MGARKTRLRSVPGVPGAQERTSKAAVLFIPPPSWRHPQDGRGRSIGTRSMRACQPNSQTNRISALEVYSRSPYGSTVLARIGRQGQGSSLYSICVQICSACMSAAHPRLNPMASQLQFTKYPGHLPKRNRITSTLRLFTPFTNLHF